MKFLEGGGGQKILANLFKMCFIYRFVPVLSSWVKHDSQFLVETGLAARLEVAYYDPQLSNILDKFLQMLLQVVELFRHFIKCQ